jgi:hypothetical protein
MYSPMAVAPWISPIWLGTAWPNSWAEAAVEKRPNASAAQRVKAPEDIKVITVIAPAARDCGF